MMKSPICVLFVSAMVIVGLGVAPALAQMQDPITVTTDKESYMTGETIIISGEVRQPISGMQVSVYILESKFGNRVFSSQIPVDMDRSFTVTTPAGGKLWLESGEYTINVQYGSPDRATTTMFSYVAGEMPPEEVVEMPTFTIDVGDQSMEIGYTITGGTITGIMTDPDASSLIVSLDTTDDGMLTLTIPRAVIDAKVDENGQPVPREGANSCAAIAGMDEGFFVLVDGEEQVFEDDMGGTSRTLTIEFMAGAETVEIIGTCVVPEFGAIAILVLAAAIVGIVALTARSRISILSRH